MQLAYRLQGARVMIDASTVPGAVEVALYAEDGDGQLSFVTAFQSGPFDTTHDVMLRVARALVEHAVVRRM